MMMTRTEKETKSRCWQLGSGITMDLGRVARDWVLGADRIARDRGTLEKPTMVLQELGNGRSKLVVSLHDG
jgi:hypothetical protein